MFFMYYGVLLCSAGLFSALASLPLPWVSYPSVSVGGTEISLSRIGLAALILQYTAFAVAFIIDRWAIRTMTIKEDIHPLRNLFHWLLAPPTLFLYSVIALYAICKFVFVGKVMARHDMAAKDGLGSVTLGGTVGACAVSDSSNKIKDEAEDDIATFYASSSVDRKTSVDRAGNHSRDVHSLLAVYAGATSPGVSMKEGVYGNARTESDALLCMMPDNFYFGIFETAVPSRDKNI